MFGFQLSTGKLKIVAGKLTTVVSAIALSLAIWSGTAVVAGTSNAQAATFSNLPSVVATSGVKDQVEGTIDKGVGTLQRNAGDASDNLSEQAKGALKQAKGDA